MTNSIAIAADSKRINFGKIKFPLAPPDLLEVQLKSFQEFFQLETTPENRIDEGLFKVFQENFPITDARSIFVLEFLDYFVDPPRYDIDECIERGLTYSVPLKAKLRLSCNDVEHVDFQTIVQDVFLGNIPYMTPKGTFVINGAERVIVSQLHRSPGVFFGQSVHPNGTKIYSARVIPFKGAWMEFATDINTVMYAYIDRKKKFPVTTLLRAIGYDTDKAILNIFGLAEEVPNNRTELSKFVGRKLAARVLRSWTEDFVDEDTGEVVTIERNEIILDRDVAIDEANLELILESGLDTVIIQKEELNEANRKDWENQELKHVHSAGHYGTYIFTPQPLLSFFDIGIQNYTGSSIRLEAHLQQDAQFSNAMESSSGIRFGNMSIALVLQILLPLLLIFMCFNAVSYERENGTLKLLLIQGASVKSILWQKIAAYTVIALSILLTVLLVSVLFPVVNGFPFTTETLWQITLLFFFYGVFYFIVIAASIAISAMSKTSKNSLMALLGCWLFFIILLPKYAANLGDDLYPLPSKKAMQLGIAKEIKNGVDGHNPNDKRSEIFVDSILKAYKVDTISKLPINIDGLLMQADEDYKAIVTNKYFGTLYNQITRQNKVTQYASLVNPFFALKDLSMGICKTDYSNQVIFEQQVQDYRLYMMRYLNEYMSYNTKAGDYDTKATRDVFTKLKKFNYKPLTVTQSLSNYSLLIVAFLLWIIVATVLVNFASKKLNII